MHIKIHSWPSQAEVHTAAINDATAHFSYPNTSVTVLLEYLPLVCILLVE